MHYRWIDGWMNRWTDGQRDGLMDRPIDGLTDGWTAFYIVDGQIAFYSDAGCIQKRFN